MCRCFHGAAAAYQHLKTYMPLCNDGLLHREFIPSELLTQIFPCYDENHFILQLL
jgi:hypothetical protein